MNVNAYQENHTCTVFIMNAVGSDLEELVILVVHLGIQVQVNLNNTKNG